MDEISHSTKGGLNGGDRQPAAAPRNAAAPAMTTDVSTTPLGAFLDLGDKSDLRLSLSFATASP